MAFSVKEAPKFEISDLEKLISANLVPPASLSSILREIDEAQGKALFQLSRRVFQFFKFAFIEASEGKLEYIKTEHLTPHHGSKKVAFQNKQSSLKAIGKVFLECFGVVQVCSFDKDENILFRYSWRPDNPFLNPKPVIPFPEIEELDSELKKLILNDAATSDVTFKSENLEIKAHKKVLSQCSFFKAQFSMSFKEGQSKEATPIPGDFAYENFMEVLTYLYTRQLPLNKNCCETFRLAEFLGLDVVKQIAKAQISAYLQPEDFLEFAVLVGRDSELETLCCWFARVHADIIEKLDLASLSSLDALHVFQIARKYIPALIKPARAQFAIKLVLDSDFIEVCTYLLFLKDARLRSLFVEELEQKKELVDQLLKGKKDQFQMQWKAYKNLATGFGFK